MSCRGQFIRSTSVLPGGGFFGGKENTSSGSSCCGIRDVYDVRDSHKLGEGACGKIVLGKHRSTQRPVAVKIIPKANDALLLARETAIMRPLDHPHIVKLLETFEDEFNHYLVLEHCDGGELAEFIALQGFVNEVQTAIIMQQLLGALRLMQRNRIRHNDLSLVNMMFKTRMPIEKNCLKVIDFGSAQRVGDVGGEDMLHCGFILRTLLCAGCKMKAMTGARPSMNPQAMAVTDRDWNKLSRSGRDLLEKMLHTDPTMRVTAREALMHPFITRKVPRRKRNPDGYALWDKFNSFLNMDKIKRAALHIMADRLDEEEIWQERCAFMALDANGDGLLTPKEIAEGDSFKVNQNIKRILRELDADCIGVLDYTAFLSTILERKTYMAEKALKLAFAVFDEDGNGKLSPSELHSAIVGFNSARGGSARSLKLKEELETLVAEADLDEDGHLNFKEFASLIGRPDVPATLAADRMKTEDSFDWIHKETPLERQAVRSAKIRAMNALRKDKKQEKKEKKAKAERERSRTKGDKSPRRRSRKPSQKKKTITSSQSTSASPKESEVKALATRAPERLIAAAAADDDVFDTFISTLADCGSSHASSNGVSENSDASYSSDNDDSPRNLRQHSMPTNVRRGAGIGPSQPDIRPTAVPCSPRDHSPLPLPPAARLDGVESLDVGPWVPGTPSPLGRGSHARPVGAFPVCGGASAPLPAREDRRMAARGRPSAAAFSCQSLRMPQAQPEAPDRLEPVWGLVRL